MHNLVSYDSDSTDSDDSSSSSDGKESEELNKDNEKKDLLPRADELFIQKTQDVFRNRFTEEEDARHKLLEKHVKKMVETDVKNLKTINGKKICFNYQKGKCKFGSKCMFAHYSDLSVENSMLPTTSASNKKATKRSYDNDSLIPSKKSMKLYKGKTHK